MKIKSFLFFLIVFSFEAIIFKANAQTTVVVGSSPSNYTTLGLAFNAINNGTLTGYIIIQIKSNIYESSAATINASGNYDSLLIYPLDTVVISANLTEATLKLNSASNIKIDGRINQTGTYNGLTIKNHNTASSSSGLLVSYGSNNNTIKYCNITCSNSQSNSSNGGMITFTNGASYNTISNCNVYGTGNVSCSGIFAQGSNNNNYVLNNNFYDIYSHMIHLSGSNDTWTIIGNSFYQTDTVLVNFSSASAIKIYETNGFSNSNIIISNNKIGGSAPNCGGTPWTIDSLQNNFTFKAIEFDAFNNSASHIFLEGNIIKNYHLNNCLFYGIDIYGSNSGEIKGNIIGDSIGKGSISTNYDVYGIYLSASDTIIITDNFIGSITTKGDITCIEGGYSAAHNLIGSRITPHSIECIGNTSVEICGIKNTQIVDNNQVMNLTSSAPGYNQTSNNWRFITGIKGDIITNNHVCNLYTADTTSSYYLVNGIAGSNLYGFYGSRVNNNFVHNLWAASNCKGTVMGISSHDTCFNNIVSLGMGDTSSYEIIGLGGTQCFNNTVLIGGWHNGSNIITTAFLCYNQSQQWIVRYIKNNLFINTRKNTILATGTHICANVELYYDWPSLSNNQYYIDNASGSIGKFGLIPPMTINQWYSYEPTAISANPMLINAGDSILAFSYKPTASNTGVAINTITKDYFGNTRLNPPTIGAIESWATYTIFDSLTATACDQYNFNGQLLSNSGNYTDTIQNSNGLNSITTLELTVNNNYYGPLVYGAL